MNTIFSRNLLIVGSFLIGTVSHTYSMSESGEFPIEDLLNAGRDFHFGDLLNALFGKTLIGTRTKIEIGVQCNDTARDYRPLRMQPERIKKFFPSIPATDPISWHQVLGVDASASNLDINRAYRKLSLKVHPDKGGDDAVFDIINKAKKEGLGDLNDLYTVSYKKTEEKIYEDRLGRRFEEATSCAPVEIPPLKLPDVLDEYDQQTVSQLDPLIKKCQQTLTGQKITLALLLFGTLLHKYRKKVEKNAWINRNWLAKKIDACCHEMKQRYPRLSRATPWIVSGTVLSILTGWSWNSFDILKRLENARNKVTITPIAGHDGETPFDVRVFQKDRGSNPMGYMTGQEEHKQFEPVRRAQSMASYRNISRYVGGFGLALITCGLLQKHTPAKPVEDPVQTPKKSSNLNTAQA